MPIRDTVRMSKILLFISVILIDFISLIISSCKVEALQTYKCYTIPAKSYIIHT
jgi:hypothetical protein